MARIPSTRSPSGRLIRSKQAIELLAGMGAIFPELWIRDKRTGASRLSPYRWGKMAGAEQGNLSWRWLRGSSKINYDCLLKLLAEVIAENRRLLAKLEALPKERGGRKRES